jgi:hypothetical protein
VQSNVVTKTWVAAVTGPPDLIVSTGAVAKVGGTLQVELRIKNNGGSQATNVRITSVTLLAPVTYAGPALPVNKGSLAPGATATQVLSLNLNGVASGSVVRFTVRGTYQDTAGASFQYSANRLVRVP